MEAAYADPGLARFAAWVHETDRAMAAELERRGYAVAETTRAMSLELSDIRLPRPELELASPDWDEYLSRFEPSRGLLARRRPDKSHLRPSPSKPNRPTRRP
jgi:hypothetical protein